MVSTDIFFLRLMNYQNSSALHQTVLFSVTIMDRIQTEFMLK
jgi:hypothetical protein